MTVLTSHRNFEHLEMRIQMTPECVGGVPLAVGDFSEPGGDGMPYEISLLVEQNRVDPLRVMQTAQVLAKLAGAATLISIDRLAQKPGLQSFYGGNLSRGPHGRGGQNGQYDKKGQR